MKNLSAITENLDITTKKYVDDSIPTKTSDLTNDSDFVSDSSYVHTDNNYTSAAKSKVDKITFGDTTSSLLVGTSTTTSVNIYGNSTNLIGISTTNTTDGDNIRHRLVVQSDKTIIQTIDYSSGSESYTTLYTLEPKPYMRNLSVITSSFDTLNQTWTAKYDGFILMCIHTESGTSILRVHDTTSSTSRYMLMLSDASSSALYISGMFPCTAGHTYKIANLANATVYYTYVINFI